MRLLRFYHISLRMKSLFKALICFIALSCQPKSSLLDKDIEQLSSPEMHAIQFEPVSGDYLTWTGIRFDSVTMQLLLDRPNRFAIKVFFDDTDWIIKNDQPINFSGRWSENGDQIKLDFYFPPESFPEYFDSVKNLNNIKVLNSHSIEFNKNLRIIWINQTECKRK